MNMSKSAQQVLNALLFSCVLFSWNGICVANEVASNGPQMVQSQSDRVNINQASLDQLLALPGIGKVKASAIIEYRQQVGAFASVEELQQIKGIGSKLYAKLVSKIEI